MKVKHMNALLVEIMMAVLFFALAAVIILELFAAGHGLGARADAVGRAVNHAQMISEQLYAADDMGAVLKQNGFGYVENCWHLHAGDYSLDVRVFSEETEAGILYTAEISACTDGGETVELPFARYAAGEVAQ